MCQTQTCYLQISYSNNEPRLQHLASICVSLIDTWIHLVLIKQGPRFPVTSGQVLNDRMKRSCLIGQQKS